MELLKNETDTSSANSGSSGISETGDFFVTDSYCSFGWDIEAPEQTQHRGLARTRRTHY
jgi:hypothetical protein